MATLDMDRIVDLLAERGIASYVEQTGGGCATIQVGQPVPDAAGDGRYPVLGGPGWFEGPGWTRARADTADFSVGPDDDGIAEPWSAGPDTTEADVADEIAARLTPR
jgi:hypothetical protein